MTPDQHNGHPSPIPPGAYPRLTYWEDRRATPGGIYLERAGALLHLHICGALLSIGADADDTELRGMLEVARAITAAGGQLVDELTAELARRVQGRAAAAATAAHRAAASPPAEVTAPAPGRPPYPRSAVPPQADTPPDGAR